MKEKNYLIKTTSKIKCIPTTSTSSPPPPLPPTKSKVFSCRKSHLTTAVIFSRPGGATMEEGKQQICFLIATIKHIS